MMKREIYYLDDSELTDNDLGEEFTQWHYK